MGTMSTRRHNCTTTILHIWNNNKQAFLSAIVAGMVIHFSIYGYGLMNPDAIWLGEKYIADWEVAVGRWGLKFFDYLHGGVNAPVIITMIALFWFSVGGILINEIFEVNSRAVRVIVPLIIIANPLVSVTITYYYCADAYAASFCLAVVAVWLLTLKNRTKTATVLAILCVTCSLSIYQSSLGVTAGLGTLFGIFQIFQNPQNTKKNINYIGRLLMVGFIGTVLYYMVLQVVLNIRGLSMMAYKGADNIGIGYIIASMVKSIPHAYIDFYAYFLKNSIMVNSYLVGFCYIALWILFVIACVMGVTNLRIKFSNLLIAVLYIAILPVACNVIDIMAPDTRIILLTSGGLAILPPAMLAICSMKIKFVSNTDSGRSKRNCIVYILSGAISLLLIANYILVVNTDGLVMREETDKTLALANRICTTLEQRDDIQSGHSLMIAGAASEGNYPVVSTLSNSANNYAKFGLTWSTPDGSLNCWRQVFRRYLGATENWCTETQFREIIASEEFKNMPSYPENGAIREIGDIVVVKVSPVAELS